MARNTLQFKVAVKDDASHNLQRISKEADGVTSSFKRLAGAAAGIVTLNEISQMANTYRLLQNRLRLVTANTAELAAVTDQLVKVSIRSRTSFQATADLYARVARSSRELGLSQQELLDFTETVSKSIRISGSTSQEAAAGVIQFGQALASSRLSGDELRSVLEQMPRLAQAIAEGMGVGIGTLRELGEAGELSATKVLKALEDAGPEIAAEFEQLKPLVSEAFDNLNTALLTTIGLLDETAGISGFVAEAIIEFADEVIILGRSLTGALDPAEELTDATAQASVAMLIAAGTASILATSLKDTLFFAFNATGQAAGAFAAQIAALARGEFSEAAAIGTMFKEDLLDGFGKDTFRELQEKLLLDAGLTIHRIQQVLGDFRIERPDVDLSASGDPLDQLTRKQREARAKNVKGLQAMMATLQQSNQAFVFARDIGLEYADALAIVKANTLAVGASNDILHAKVLGLLEVNRRLKDEAEARIQAEKDAAKALEDALKFSENVARRAAENIQDAFADFLFDPFEDGVRGMLKGFVDALRTMLSQALAFKILTNLPGDIGAFFSSNVTRAAGGPVTAGMPVLVGERGPEIFIPNASGSIKNNSASKASGGGATFVTNIDARGADPSLIARLPAIMEQRDRRLMLMVKDYIETGGVTL